MLAALRTPPLVAAAGAAAPSPPRAALRLPLALAGRDLGSFILQPPPRLSTFGLGLRRKQLPQAVLWSDLRWRAGHGCKG